MEALKKNLEEITVNFNSKMADFQKELKVNNSSTSVTVFDINTEFATFRQFVLSSLSALHAQFELLSKIVDKQEMHMRRKMLLLHGIEEDRKEDCVEVVTKLISKNLKIPNIDSSVISRCFRLGHPKDNKKRPILIKFKDILVKNKVWYSKTGLKNSGVTMSEFLTHSRHNIFMAARQKFGINKCWSHDGEILAVSSNGIRFKINSVSDLESISRDTDKTSEVVKDARPQPIVTNRPKRTIKK